LPIAIVVAGVLLTVRIGDVWRDLGSGAAPVGVAMPAAAQTAPTAPAPAPAVATVPEVGLNQPPEDQPLDALNPGDLELLQQLLARRRTLDARGRDLETREQALVLAEQRLDGKLQELKDLQARLEALVVERDATQETQLKSLVKIYENMKPKDAAPIFDQLDMPILLDVIERMKEAKVAPILALMSADRAKSVTEELASRREMPPPG
jgi:flagellar motility protein MotE (MotC chaperone)